MNITRKILLAVLLITVTAGIVLTSHGRAQATGSTRLLYRYVTSQAGFDTGIVISNTTADPFGTAPVLRACKLFFYGSNAPGPFTTPVIPAGQNYPLILSAVAPNFPRVRGYRLQPSIGARFLFHKQRGRNGICRYRRSAGAKAAPDFPRSAG